LDRGSTPERLDYEGGVQTATLRLSVEIMLTQAKFVPSDLRGCLLTIHPLCIHGECFKRPEKNSAHVLFLWR